MAESWWKKNKERYAHKGFYLERSLLEDWHIVCREILGKSMTERLRYYINIELEPFRKEIERRRHELERESPEWRERRRGRVNRGVRESQGRATWIIGKDGRRERAEANKGGTSGHEEHQSVS